MPISASITCPLCGAPMRSTHVATWTCMTCAAVLRAEQAAHEPPARPRLLWYVASPYAPRPGESIALHIQWARLLARWVYDQGAWPIAPHLFAPQFLDDTNPAERGEGLAWGLARLAHAQRVIIPAGVAISTGMRQELVRAAELQIPVTAVPLPPTNYEEVR